MKIIAFVLLAGALGMALATSAFALDCSNTIAQLTNPVCDPNKLRDSDSVSSRPNPSGGFSFSNGVDAGRFRPEVTVARMASIVGETH